MFVSKGPQEEAGSWVQGQAEDHTQGLQKGREKANDVIQEIRQEVDDRKCVRQKHRKVIGKKAKSLVRMAKNCDT